MTPDAPQIMPITRPLKAARRRARLLACAQGLWHVAWIAGAAIIVAGLLDYLVHLPGLVRLLVALGIVGFVLQGLYRWVLRPAYARVSLDVIAARVEELNPRLQDRLRSALTFANGEVTGSRRLQESVVQESLEAAEGLDWSGVTDARPMWRSLLAILPVGLVGLLLVWWQPGMARIAMDRLVSPMGSVQWPRSVQIELLGKLPQQVPAGQRLDLAVRLVRGDRPSRKVVVNWQIADQTVQRQLMQRNEDGTYTAGIDFRIAEAGELPSATIWIEAGDDSYGPVNVQVIPRLQVAAIDLAAEPPAYCAMKPMNFNLRLQPANVPAGSQVMLSMTFNRPARNVRLEALRGSEDARLPEMEWIQASPKAWSVTWQAMRSMRFRVLAEDENGYANPAAEEYELIARPDQSPIIQLESPRRSEDRTAEATVPLEASVEDDYGIKQVSLEARLLAANQPTTEPAAPGVLDLVVNGAAGSDQVTFAMGDKEAQRKRHKLAFPWKLASFPSSLLKAGDVIEFQLAATDTYEIDGKGHDPARTPVLRITIVSQEQLLQRAYDELRQIASQIAEIRTRQERLRGDTVQLREDLGAKQGIDAADQAVADRIVDQQQRAAAQTRDAASRVAAVGARLSENASPNKQLRDSLKETADLLGQAEESAMKPAAADVKQSTQQDQPQEQRTGTLEKAAGEQKKASDQLSQALDKLGDVGGLQRAVDIIQDLLTQQGRISRGTEDAGRQNAGKRPEDLSPEQRDQMAKLAKEQMGLSKATEQALEQLKTMAQRNASSDPTAAQAMKAAAQTGQEQSVAQNQQKASEAITRNQSSQASASQQSAESGLQQMLDSLKEAQRRRLEELVRKLASMQEALKNLVRRQAGHNLDNLALQKLPGGGETELVKTLSEKAARTGETPEPTLQQLEQSQQQTYRNATDLAEDLDKLKGGTEISAQVNRAAGRMERAIPLLRKGQFKEALTPPQMEALAALEAAAARLEEMRKKAQQEQTNQKQDELRKQYEEVRQLQQQVRDVTRLLDQALSGERKKRADLVRLAQLAGDQQKLSDRTKQLGQQLRDLGSTMFVQTSDGISTDMATVSADLGNQKTGRPTQFVQGQVVSRLDMIIRGLTPPKPDESKYASRGGGGGGGGGGKRKLPPAAELQLLKELEQMVHAGTAQSTPQDKDILPTLSQQQAKIRSAFDQLIAKAMQGKAKMPDEKESRQPLAEESEVATGDDLDRELLDGAPAGKDAGDVTDLVTTARRMTRSQVRLGEQNDPGEVTQLVQKRIIEALDRLIDEASKQQQQQASSPEQQQSQQQQQADPKSRQKPSQTQQTPAQTPAQQSQLRNMGRPGASGGDIRETAKEWGGISQRDRQAIIESASENIIEKYRTMTEEYYRALSNKATESK